METSQSRNLNQASWGYGTLTIMDGRVYNYHPETSGHATSCSRRVIEEKTRNVKNEKNPFTQESKERMSKVLADFVILCLDAANGKEMWKITGDWLPKAPSTPTVDGEFFVVSGTQEGSKSNGALACLKISASGAKPVWYYSIKDQMTPVPQAKKDGFGTNSQFQLAIYNGNAYSGGYTEAILDIQTGQIHPVPVQSSTYSVVMSDGCTFGDRRWWKPVLAAPLQLQDMPSAPVPEHAETAVVAGRWFIRGTERFMCYDMRIDKTPDRYSVSVARDEPVQGSRPEIAQLGAAYQKDRLYAVKNLTRIGPPTASELAGIVVQGAWLPAKAAAETLSLMASESHDPLKMHEAAQILVQALPKAVVQMTFCRVCLLTETARLLHPEALKSASEMTVYCACAVLERMGEAGICATGGLLDVMSRKDPFLFRSSALALAGIGPKAGPQAGLALAKDLKNKKGEELFYTLVAIQGTGAVNSNPALDILASLAFSENEEAEQISGFPDPLIVGGGLDTPDFSAHVVSYKAAQCLKTMNPDEVVPAAIKTFKTGKKGESKLTEMHYEVLGTFGPKAKAALSLLEKAVDSEAWLFASYGKHWIDRIKGEPAQE